MDNGRGQWYPPDSSILPLSRQLIGTGHFIIIIRRRSAPTGTVELLKVLKSFRVLLDIDKMSETGTVDCPLTEVYDSPNPHLDRLLNKTTPPCPFKPFIFFAVAFLRFVISDKNLLRMYIFSDHWFVLRIYVKRRKHMEYSDLCYHTNGPPTPFKAHSVYTIPTHSRNYFQVSLVRGICFTEFYSSVKEN